MHTNISYERDLDNVQLTMHGLTIKARICASNHGMPYHPICVYMRYTIRYRSHTDIPFGVYRHCYTAPNRIWTL